MANGRWLVDGRWQIKIMRKMMMMLLALKSAAYILILLHLLRIIRLMADVIMCVVERERKRDRNR